MCWFAKWLGFWSTISETSRVTAVATDSNSMIPVQSLSAIHSIAYIMNMFHCPHQFVWDDSSGPPISMYFSVESCCEIINFKGFFATRSNQTRIGTWGFIKKNRPFNHIFGGDRILRTWYRGINNAGPRKGAQGRAQDIPYQSISPYHHGIWRIFIECGKKTRARKSAQGRSPRGPILPKSNRNFRQPPLTFLKICHAACFFLQGSGKICHDKKPAKKHWKGLNHKWVNS